MPIGAVSREFLSTNRSICEKDRNTERQGQLRFKPLFVALSLALVLPTAQPYAAESVQGAAMADGADGSELPVVTVTARQC